MTDSRPVVTVKPGAPFVGKQGLTYIAGLTGETSGSNGICMTVATIPPGGRAKAHLHQGIETAVYVIEGSVRIRFGHQLDHSVEASAGEYSYVPPGTPHVVMNVSAVPCRAVVAHTAADDQAGIVMLPELDALVV